MKINPAYWVLGAMALIAAAMATNWNKILTAHIMRNDSSGLGHFGAPRGRRTHNGVDLLALPGEPVRAPFDGRFVRSGYVYEGDARYRLVVLKGRTYEVKLMYVLPDPALVPGQMVRAGDIVGKAQNIAAKWGGSMQPHVHVEAYELASGDLVDPTALLDLS